MTSRPSGSVASLLYAPRNLNAPLRWKHSAFRKTSSPSVRDVSTGVRWATPASRCAAAWTSSSSITGTGSPAGGASFREEAEAPELPVDDQVRARVADERRVAAARDGDDRADLGRDRAFGRAELQALRGPPARRRPV